MIINGSINHSYSGRKRKTHRKVKKIEPAFKPLVRKEVYRRDVEYYPSAPMTMGKDMPDSSYKKEVSKSYTLAPAYNKGAYQVISKENIKHIGR